MFSSQSKAILPSPSTALPGRSAAMKITNRHFVLDTPLLPPYPENSEIIVVGMGCFWGAEKKFWELPGVITTSVGYTAGYTPNPTYEEVCTGLTGHNEVVRVVFEPMKISMEALLRVFWESHNPTQGMRQGNDRGTQYRSGIYFSTPSQQRIVQQSLQHYQAKLNKGLKQSVSPITTEIVAASEFFFAEDYHQQYLAKNPNGYCGLGGTGVRYE